MSQLSASNIFDPLSGRQGLLLAVSGGRDSTALMVLAAQWWRENRPPCRISVATVDHGLRPEAQDETRMVAANARSLGLDCTILNLLSIGDGCRTSAAGGNIQSRAREARYSALAAAAGELGLDTIVTAHHREDQAETVLLRLARGSGVYGLGAMREMSLLDIAGPGDIVLARPLLGFSRSELHAIAEESGLGWTDDPSNKDMAFARVRVRSVAPALDDVGLTAARLSETAAHLQRAGDALDHYADEHLKSTVKLDEFGSAIVDVGKFVDAPDETVLRAFGRLLQAIGGSAYTPRFDRLEALFAAIRETAADDRSLRRTLNGCVADLDKGQLRLYREWGRSGLETMPAIAGGRQVFDRRFIVALADDVPATYVIGALGPFGRYFRGITRSAILRTLPGLYHGSDLVAVPDFLNAPKALDFGTFACREQVAERLFNLRTSLADTNDENSC